MDAVALSIRRETAVSKKGHCTRHCYPPFTLSRNRPMTYPPPPPPPPSGDQPSWPEGSQPSWPGSQPDPGYEQPTMPPPSGPGYQQPWMPPPGTGYQQPGGMPPEAGYQQPFQQPYQGAYQQPYQQPGMPPPPGAGYQQPGGMPPPGVGYQQQWQGQPPPKNSTTRYVLMGVGGAVVLILIIVLIGVALRNPAPASSSSSLSATSNSPAASSPPSGPASSSAPPVTSTKSSGPVGTTFKVSGFDHNEKASTYYVAVLAVNQIAAPSDSFNSADPGHHLASVEVKITGLTGQAQDDANLDMNVQGSNEQTYPASFHSVAAGTDFNFGDFDDQPGQSSIGYLTFELPNAVKIASMTWDANDQGSDVTWRV